LNLEKLKCLEEILPQCHSVDHKSHLNYHASVHLPQLGEAGDHPRKPWLDMKGSHVLLAHFLYVFANYPFI
jgi:hypothetical protein